MSFKTVQTKPDKNTRTAKALIALGCVKETGEGYEVKMPVMRNQNPVIFIVARGTGGEFVCDCFGFKDGKSCAHIIAAEMPDAAKEEFAGEIELHYENVGYEEAA